jgi:uncharacterized protein involved in type VI secretion and phage assembly
MSSLLTVIRAVARDELTTHRAIELGTVTEVTTNSGGSGDHHLECSVRLRGSGLELQRVPVSVGRPGWSTVPRVGDLVVIGFVGGDLNGPVVMGTIHDESTAPPDAEPDEVVYAVPDSGGERRIEIQLPNGNKITVTDDAVVIDYGGSTFNLASGGDITIEAGGNLTLKASQAVKIESGTDLTAKAGTTATVEASATAKLKGAMTTIAGITQFSSS